MTGRTVSIQSTEPQASFHALTCKHPAFVGGFGTGKSETMANQAFMDASHSSSALIGLYEPTYDLIRLIMAPRMEQKLTDYGIRYKYNKSENIIYSSSPQFGDFILRTLDNPARIVGYETYRSHVDELDTLKEDHAQQAWRMILARNRQKPKGLDNPLNRVSAYCTPEGFRFMYKTWAKDPKPEYEMIQASTLSNPFLPDDYVDTLRASYPPQLIEAYINGAFVNLTSGAVYPQYDRSLNSSGESITDNEPLFIGMDFNVGKMAAVIHVKRKGQPHAVEEIIDAYDTPEMIAIIKRRYWQELSHNNFSKSRSISIYPDSSGKNRKSVGASDTDISLLQQAGFHCYYDSVNPRVRDRITTMNANFCNADGERKYFINADKCPTYAAGLEQQVYNKHGEPDKQSGVDHGNDAGGYFIVAEYPVIRNITNTTYNWDM